MSKPLEILINASLKMDTINTQLKELSTKGVNLGVDSKGIQNVIKQVNDLQKQINGKGFKVIDDQEAIKGINKAQQGMRELYTDIDKAVQAYSKFGQVKVTSSFDPISKELQGFNMQVEKADGLVEKLKFDLVKLQTSNGENAFELVGVSQIDNTQKLVEQQLQASQKVNKQIADDQVKQQEQAAKDEQKLIEQMESFRIQSIANRERREREADTAQLQAIQRNMDLARQETESEAQKTAQLQHQISLYQQQAEISARGLTRQFGDNVDQNAMNTYLNSVRELNTDTPEVRQRMQQLGVDFRNIREESLQSASQVSSFGSALKEAFSKFPIWMLTATIFYAPFRALQSGIQIITELDSAMTDLKKVTNETSDTYAQFAQNVNQSANSIGASTADFINATTEFARIGLNLQQSQASAKQAMIYANVGDFGSNSAAASQDLISTMKAYNMQFDDQGKNLQKIVDLYNNVSNKYSIDAQGIGDAMKRGAASLAVAGNSIQQSVALITAANDSIQDPAKVGNALKTVSMRLMGVNEQGGTIAGLVPKLEKQFNQLGLTLKDSNGNLKSTYDIMIDLAGVFNSGKLNNLEKSNILNLVAGKQQGNIVAGLLANVNDLKSALNDGMNSAGSSMQELNVYLDSISARMNKFKNAAVGFWQTSLNSDEFKSFIDAGAGLLNLLSHITQQFGLLPPVVLATSLAIMGFNDNLRKATTSKGLDFLASLKNGFREVQTSAEASVVGIEAVTTAETALAETETAVSAVSKGASIFGFLTGSILPVAGIMAATYAIEKLVGAYSDYHQQQVKQQQEAQALENTYQNNADTIKQLANQYENLSARVSNGTITQNNQDYIDVQNRLHSLLPQVTQNIDSQGNAHLKNVQAVNQEIASLDKLNQLNSTKFTEDFSKSLTDINKQIKDTQDSISKIGTSQLVSQGVMADQFGTQTHKLTTDDQMNQILQGMQLDQQLQQRVDLFKKLATEYANSKGLTDKLTKSDQNYLNQLVDNNKAQLDSTDKAKKFQDQLQNTVTVLADLQKTVGKGIDVSKIFGDLSSKSDQQEKQLLVIDDSIKKYSDGSISAKQFADALSKVGISGSKASDILKNLTIVQQDSISATKAQTDAQNALQNMLDGTTSLEDTLGKELVGYTAKEIDQQTQLIQLYSALSQVTNKNAEQMALYNQVKAQLISLFPEEYNGQKLSLTGMMDEVNARKVMSQAAVDSASNRMSAEEQVTYNLAQNLQKQEQIIKAMIKNYEALMMSAVTVDPKNGAVAMSGVAMHWYNQMKDEEKQLSTVSASYISTTAKLAKEMNYKVDFTTPDFPSAGSTGSGSSKKGSKGSGSGSSSSAANDAKQKAQDLANSIIQIYKDMYQKEEDMALAANQKQLDALDAQHQKVLDNLTAEEKAYEDSVNKKLALIDKQSAAQSYNEGLKQKQQAIQDLQNQINVMSLDNSPEGQAKLADLKKQLAQDQQDLTDTQSQHTTDLRKQNLQDGLDSYKADIQRKQDAEDAKYNAAKDELNKERDAIQKHYDNLINDQRKFTKIQNEIMSGHYDTAKKDLADFTKYLKDHMSDIGQSITENLLDNISAASKSMSSLGSGKSSGSSSKGSSSSSSKNRYYTVKSGDTLGEIADKYYGHNTKTYIDKISKANHISDSSKLKVGERLLIPFKDGGYTGNYEGVAYLHQKEQVFKAEDTTNLLNASKAIRGLAPLLQNFVQKVGLPDIKTLGNKVNNISMNVNIASLSGDKQGAINFFGIIQNEMNKLGVNN